MGFLDGTGIEVETELDLSLKQQFLDLVLIRRMSPAVSVRLPDGFELATHNLVTFKSHRQTLDAFTLEELYGHYANYRKQASPSLVDLLPEEEFRLFAVSARYPEQLARKVSLTPVSPGVYDSLWGKPIRVIVAGQMPKEEQNALLHLFSAREELLQYGREHYCPRSTETSTLLLDLFKTYREDPAMAATKLQQYVRETLDRLLPTLTPEERLKGLPPEERLKGISSEELCKHLPPEERLKGLPAEERLKGLPPEERLKGLPPEERLKGLPPEERLKGMSAEEILKAMPPVERERLAKHLKANGSSGSGL
jgi:hypothetical protein